MLGLYIVSHLLLLRCFGFDLVREYSGSNFFANWEFYGSWDNLTNGDVNWLNQSAAVAENLIGINEAQHAIIRVDNTTNVPFYDKRDSIRITSTDEYDFGTVWIFDVVHLPWGCSVWPAIWTKGTKWPNNGEIDIVEGVNLMTQNQMALHTLPGCMHDTPPDQLGFSNTSPDCSTPSGCTVLDVTNQASFGQGFAQAGGGVWAAQFDVSGVFIWFWNRTNIPQNLRSSTAPNTLDISSWGSPVASYPSTSCNMSQSFGPQQLVVDITLCGDYAGLPQVYTQTCSSEPPNNPSPPNPPRTGPTCYPDNVPGPGSPRFDEAYFEISYIRAYTTGVSSSTATATSTDLGGGFANGSPTPPPGSPSDPTTIVQNGSTIVFFPNTEIPNSNSGDLGVRKRFSTSRSLSVFWMSVSSIVLGIGFGFFVGFGVM